MVTDESLKVLMQLLYNIMTTRFMHTILLEKGVTIYCTIHVVGWMIFSLKSFKCVYYMDHCAWGYYESLDHYFYQTFTGTLRTNQAQ